MLVWRRNGCKGLRSVGGLTESLYRDVLSIHTRGLLSGASRRSFESASFVQSLEAFLVSVHLELIIAIRRCVCDSLFGSTVLDVSIRHALTNSKCYAIDEGLASQL